MRLPGHHGTEGRVIWSQGTKKSTSPTQAVAKNGDKKRGRQLSKQPRS